MVEGARLESVYTVKRIKGSNPFSPPNKIKPPCGAFLFGGEKGFDLNPRFDKFAGSEFERTQCGPSESEGGGQDVRNNPSLSAR